MEPITTSTSLTDRVAKVIRDAITTGDLLPGSRHSVQGLAQQLGVSRTPVREALLRLAEVGVVRFEPNRGVVILRPTVGDLQELFQLRLLLEPWAAYRAASRVSKRIQRLLEEEVNAMEAAAKSEDDEDRIRRFIEHDVKFHDLVLRAAENERLTVFLRNCRDATRALGDRELLRGATESSDMSDGRDLGVVANDHRLILEALLNQDAEKAADVMYYHVQATGDMLMREQAKADPTQQHTFDPAWAEAIPRPSGR
jgi:DNA-binding GntR family transcriptional regulator